MRLVASLCFAAVLCTASFAEACSCIAPPPPREALKKSAAVFVGKVKSVERKGLRVTVTLEIQKTWKGTKGKTALVQTANNSAACGYNFQAGKSYLVYCFKTKAKKNAGALQTNICTRTRPLERAKDDLKELGDGKKPS